MNWYKCKHLYIAKCEYTYTYTYIQYVNGIQKQTCAHKYSCMYLQLCLLAHTYYHTRQWMSHRKHSVKRHFAFRQEMDSFQVNASQRAHMTGALRMRLHFNDNCLYVCMWKFMYYWRKCLALRLFFGQFNSNIYLKIEELFILVKCFNKYTYDLMDCSIGAETKIFAFQVIPSVNYSSKLHILHGPLVGCSRPLTIHISLHLVIFLK